MPLYRAKELLRIAHWSSNASLAASGDPYFKVRSICDIFNENSTRLWYPQERISGDELTQGMWTRFALAKQVRNKKVFHGLQAVAVADNHGYVVRLHFDGDVKCMPPEDFFPSLSPTGRRMAWMMRCITQHHSTTGFKITTDRRFSSPALATALHLVSRAALLGTFTPKYGLPLALQKKKVSKNQLPAKSNEPASFAVSTLKEFPVKDVQWLSSAVLPELDIVVSAQYDKALLYMLSSNRALKFARELGGVRAAGEANRYDYQHDYNMDMDGDDVSDHLRGFSNVTYAFRKWPLKLFFAFFLPQAEVNAYVLQRIRHVEQGAPALGHRQHRDLLALGLLRFRSGSQFAAERGTKRRRSGSLPPAKKPRIDTLAVDHGWVATEVTGKDGRRKRRRCVVCSTKKEPVKTNMVCSSEQCTGRGFCSIKCFQAWHDKSSPVFYRNKVPKKDEDGES
jgi:hypothetical protein